MLSMLLGPALHFEEVRQILLYDMKDIGWDSSISFYNNFDGSD